MPVITLSNGRQFVAEPGTSLLDAAAAQGLALAHSCRTGRCGSCKSRVLSGDTAALRDPTSLSAEERDAGWILTCTHEARSDAQLDIEDLSVLAGIVARTTPTRIDTIERLTPDVLRIQLRLPPSASLRFLAGQYIDLTGPDGTRRSYSLASDPAAPERLELLVGRLPGGRLSAYWFERARVNDLLRIHGPRGSFFLRPVAGLDLVFLATGTGIAPIKAMLTQLARAAAGERPTSVTVYWGARHAADLHWDPQSVLSAWPGARHVPVLSRADAAWAGARGHVQDVLLAEGKSLARAAVYACGSPQMIDDARQRLAATGLPERRFFADAFVSSD